MKYFWTIQSKAFLEQEGDPLIAQSSAGPKTSWDQAYNIMNRFYRLKKGIAVNHGLIWLWVGDQPFSHSKNDYSIIYDLINFDYRFLIQSKIIQLKVPEELQLISSYHKWNDVIDYCINHKQEPDQITPFEKMFNISNLHQFDLLQCVVPYLHREWIISIEPLKVSILRKDFKDFWKDIQKANPDAKPDYYFGPIPDEFLM